MKYYGGRSGRLSPNAEPRVSNEPIKNVSQGKGPKLIVWTAKLRVSQGQPATIRAIVADDSGQLVKPDSVSIAIAPGGQAKTADPQPMPAAPSGDESQFVYAYTPPAGSPATAPNTGGRIAPPQEYEFIIRAAGSSQGASYERVAGGYFLVQDSGARLDPSKTAIDFVRGNLELSVGVQVGRTGTYMASAELWAGTDGDKPVAFARQRLEGLPPGDQQVTLLFGGKVIHDAALDGPYVVRNVRLSQVDSIPPHDSDPIEALPKTRDYRAQDFY
jgi:hypothetical protein